MEAIKNMSKRSKVISIVVIVVAIAGIFGYQQYSSTHISGVYATSTGNITDFGRDSDGNLYGSNKFKFSGSTVETSGNRNQSLPRARREYFSTGYKINGNTITILGSKKYFQDDYKGTISSDKKTIKFIDEKTDETVVLNKQ